MNFNLTTKLNTILEISKLQEVKLSEMFEMFVI